jgi:hypothetical protein
MRLFLLLLGAISTSAEAIRARQSSKMVYTELPENLGEVDIVIVGGTLNKAEAEPQAR